VFSTLRTTRIIPWLNADVIIAEIDEKLKTIPEGDAGSDLRGTDLRQYNGEKRSSTVKRSSILVDR
jgi:hypothetical protein